MSEAQSLKIRIDDEAIPSLWAELRADLEAAASGAVPERVLRTLQNIFTCLLLEMREHVLKAVWLPVDDKGVMVLQIVVSDDAKRFLTRCAEDLMILGRHGQFSDAEVRGLIAQINDVTAG